MVFESGKGGALQEGHDEEAFGGEEGTRDGDEGESTLYVFFCVLLINYLLI